MFYKQFLLKNYNYRSLQNKEWIERKQGMWGLTRGLTSPKTSLLQCKVNPGGWNMTPDGAARGGTRAPNAHDGRVE